MTNKSNDLKNLARLMPPPKRRPRMSLAHSFQLYLTIVGWMMWMVVVGYFGLRASRQPLILNLTFTGVIAALTFVDMFGIWLAVGRWRGLRATAKESDSPKAPGTGGGPRSPLADALFRAIPGDPETLWRQLQWVAVGAVGIAVAIFLTGLSGTPLFLPGNGSIKGAIALALSLWIFIEPIQHAGDAQGRRGVWAVKTGLGLALLSFASDHYFPYFGALGIVAGGTGIILGRRGAGLYAVVISAAAWAMQWWGVTLQ